ncbi:hypothetical protein KW795_00050 [Candidatus Microgenomates bacterium]|nr:hypothetical protein [Candidatus Microgenomates bacterium]
MKRLALIGLFLIFILGFYLRVMYLPQNALTFGYDQARDAINALQIVHGHLKIQGPPASQPGLFHGVLYYYVLAPAYLLGHGSPIIAAYWIAFINSLTILLVFYLTYLFAKKQKVANVYIPALVASLLYAISFEATQYATWMSNPTIAIFTVPLMYLGLWIWINNDSSKLINKIAPVIAAVGLGFSIQAEIFLLYHIVPLLIWLWIGRKNISKKQLITFILILLLSLSSMIVNEVKFGFRSIAGFSQLVTGADPNLAYAKSIGDYLILYLNQIGRIFAFNSYPGNIGVAGGFVIILALIGIFKPKNTTSKINPYVFLATWLFSHVTVVSVGGTSTPFLMVGIGPAVSILIAMYLYNWWNSDGSDKNAKYFGCAISILVLGVIIFGNLKFITRENKNGSTLFSIQKDMLLSKQLSVVDYTYEKSSGDKFSINTLTSPLWINIVWDYLYKWYGQNKYGYTPQWHGRDQIGQLGGLEETSLDTKKYFLILEPMAGIPVQYLDLTIGEENTKSRSIEEKNWGELRVQYRTKI